MDKHGRLELAIEAKKRRILGKKIKVDRLKAELIKAEDSLGELIYELDRLEVEAYNEHAAPGCELI